MLAGLIFATGDAEDKPGILAATLPFGGLTLIEFQARLLISAGASHIIVVVSRLTPELLGALNRIGRRAGSVDAVRTAAEVSEKLHPLARVLVMADGLVTTDDIVDLLAGEGTDALLVTDDRAASPGFERVGAQAAWAGLARLDPKRISEVAALPRDYDFQSTLLRVAAQAGAAQIRLPAGAPATGHGIERNGAALAERGGMILANFVSASVPWADRFVFAPLSRLVLPMLTKRAVPTLAAAGAAGAAGAIGLVALWFGWLATGMGLVIAAIAAFSIGGALAWLRDEDRARQGQRDAIPVFVALAALLLARADAGLTATATAWVVALGAIVAAGLAERAGNARIRRRWWASPAAYPLLMLPPLIAALPAIALGLSAAYAAITLGAAIEALREKP